MNNREGYLRDCGVACKPERSKQLILKERTKAGPEPDTQGPELTLSGVNIQLVRTILELSLNFQRNGAETAMLQKLHHG